MTSDRHERIMAVFHEVCDLEPEERPARLDALVAGDVELREEVEAILVHHDALRSKGDAGFLEPERHPERVGHYRILRVLDSGGMGMVYVAEQDFPRRVVALKVIKPGYATRNHLKRFELEAQVLGRLKHPGIAQIFEAGTADTGHGPQPFFAMELVDGKPITDHAEAEGLSTSARLELFVKVCDAAQHAHQKGIIHRDLKPDNILVDETGQPKILDFGVARAIDADIKTTTLRTDIGQLIGTIPYMSPEQVTGNPDDLDTRSDVYALGVLCYELLTGHLPYDLEKKAVHEALRVIREEDPRPISKTSKVFRGDLETIVQKSLEKNKNRRYAMASAIAQDVRRYLNNEPISARPPSAMYHLRKFARRHRGMMTLAGAIVAALVIGVVTLTVALFYVAGAREKERRSAERAEAVSDFLVEALASADPRRIGRDVKVVEVLDRAGDKIETEFPDQPGLRGHLHHTLGETYHGLGVATKAQRHFELASAIRRKVLGPANRETLRSMTWLGLVLLEQGKPEKAEPLFRETLETRRREFGDNDPDTLTSFGNLARLHARKGDVAEAESLYRKSLTGMRRVLGNEHKDTLLCMANFAVFLFGQGRFSEAEALVRETLRLSRRVRGERHPHTLGLLNSLGAIVARQKKYGEAEEALTRSLELHREVMGPDHEKTLMVQLNVGAVAQLRGDAKRAEEVMRDVLTRGRRTLKSDHPLVKAVQAKLEGMKKPSR